jgi:hypothetical protein
LAVFKDYVAIVASEGVIIFRVISECIYGITIISVQSFITGNPNKTFLVLIDITAQLGT